MCSKFSLFSCFRILFFGRGFYKELKGFTATWTPGRFCCKKSFKERKEDRHQWLTPVILATQKAEIRRISV
jgi:hypothetical protein